jgi:acyl-CoA synthetase (AMP-forming)/AMP-acid ligase II
VLCGQGQRQLLEGFSAAVNRHRPVALIDATWPQPVRDRAATLVAQALGGMVGPGDLVVFSSGSTGRPRGVVRTLTSWQASVEPLSRLIGLAPDDVVGVPGSLASSLSLYAAWHARQVGCRVLLADEWHRGGRLEPTVVHCVPGRLDTLLTRRAAGGLPDLHTVVVAGDRTCEAWRQGCGGAGWRLVEYYGSVEASFVLAGDGAVLTPFPGVDVDIRQGRLWARSPYLFRGYLSGDGPMRLEDGWLGPADRVEPAGSGFRVLGRPDVITTGGHTVQVADVEEALAGVPGVTGLAVVATPDSRLGELVTAVIAGGCDEVAVRAAARALPAPARPRLVIRVDELPTTPSGKPDRVALAALAARRRRRLNRHE